MTLNKSRHIIVCAPYQCELHVAVVSPPRAPTVAKDPVASCDVYAYDVHSVVDIIIGTATGEDAALVLPKVVGVEGNGECAPRQNLIDHGLLSIHSVSHRHCHSIVVLRSVTVACFDVIGVKALVSDAACLRHIFVPSLCKSA